VLVNGPEREDIASFDHATRSPSTISMRRMILERDCSASGVIADSSSDPVHHPPASYSHHHSTFLSQQGLSMRIEMKLVNGSTTSTHSQLHTPLSLSLSSSFTRSTSLLTIDDRIRGGLRKRMVRQWISWAESWYMRLWEDGGWDKGDEQRNALLLGGESVKRVKGKCD
jgi:hypothetical protein